MTVLLNLLSAALVFTPLIILLLILVPLLDKRYSPSGRYVLWIMIMTGLWLPIVWFAPRPLVIDVSVGYGETSPAFVGTLAPVMEGVAIAPVSPVGDVEIALVTEASSESLVADIAAGISFYYVVLFVWLVGVFVSAIFYMRNHFAFRRFIRQWGVAEDSADVLRIFAEECKRLDVIKSIGLVRCKGIKAPMLIGLFRPVVLLPSCYADFELQLEDLPFIFRHELTHYKRRDLWYKLALLATKCLHWFNPAVHLMTKQANKDLETICDNLTVNGLDTSDRKIYSEIILSMAAGSRRQQSPLTTHFIGGKNMLKLRFSNILSRAKKRGVAVFAPVGILVVLGLFVGFDFSPVMAEEERFDISNLILPDISYENLPPLYTMSDLELASWTLQRMSGHCDYEWAELQSRFRPYPAGVSAIPRLAPRELARRLIELENLHYLSNRQMIDRVFGLLFEHDERFRAELISRLAQFDDTDVTHLGIIALTYRLREWEELSSLLTISSGIREILLIRLAVFEGEIRDDLDTLDIARRLLEWETFRSMTNLELSQSIREGNVDVLRSTGVREELLTRLNEFEEVSQDYQFLTLLDLANRLRYLELQQN